MQEFNLDGVAQQRLEAYVQQLGDVLDNDKQRACFAIYAQGLLGDGDRKSVEPIVARACADPARMGAFHQRLLHFVGVAPWGDHNVRRIAARHAVAAMAERESVETWIVDDTGFLKQGKHSVGVQRQYTGSAGKITNCQVGVSLSLATASEHVPVDFELYLPRSWADDPERRAEGRIPDDVGFKTKPQLALDMLERARANRLPKGVVLADTGYGNDSAFRAGIRRLGLHYLVAVQATTKVWRVTDWDRPHGDALSIGDLALQLAYVPRAYRRITWREGTRHALSARFAFHRIVTSRDRAAKPLLLICEWPDDETVPSKYYLAAMPKNTTKKRLVRLLKERWRTERVYQDLKGQLGLDHFEGRRFRGWHHHVSVALCCYAFIVAERARHFSPSAHRKTRHHTLTLAA